MGAFRYFLSPVVWKGSFGLYEEWLAHPRRPFSRVSAIQKIERGDAVAVRRTAEYLVVPQSILRVAITGAPMVMHGQARELVVLGVALISLRAIDEVDDVVDVVSGHLAQQRGLLGLLEFKREPVEKIGKRAAHALDALELIGACARAAGILDLFLAGDYLAEVSRQRAVRGPEIDLESQRIAPHFGIDNPLKWRIGNETTIPVEIAVDFDGRKARRQRAACHHMFGPDRVALIVEIDEVSRPHVDGAGAEPSLTGIDAVEIDKTPQPASQFCGAVEARRSTASVLPP